MPKQALKRMFLKRAARGKQDSILLNFGEHFSSEGERKLSRLLSKHRGLYVVENASGMDSRTAKKTVKEWIWLSQVKQNGLESRLKSHPDLQKAHIKPLVEFYKRGAGKAIIAESYGKREFRRLKILDAERRANAELVMEALARKDIRAALGRFNDFVEASAKMSRLRNSTIVKNVSRMKGSVFARYGTAHSLLFPELKRLRPEAKIVFEEKPIFPHYVALLRAKILGKARNPSREVIAKAWLNTFIANEHVKLAKNLGVSTDNPKICLFSNALIDALPFASIEGVLEGMANQGLKNQDLKNLNEWVWEELCRRNSVPSGLSESKPKDQLRVMRDFCRRVYGEHSKLYQIAYGVK